MIKGSLDLLCYNNLPDDLQEMVDIHLDEYVHEKLHLPDLERCNKLLAKSSEGDGDGAYPRGADKDGRV